MFTEQDEKALEQLSAKVFEESSGTSEDQMALYYTIKENIERRLSYIRNRAERERKTRI